jgi:hypothetical protein
MNGADHIVVFGERHLRHLLHGCANYYNRSASACSQSPMMRARCSRSAGHVFGKQ